MNDFLSSFYPLEKLQFGSDDTVLYYYSILRKYSLVQQNSALKACGKRQSHPIDKKEQELAVASLPFAKSNLNLCQSRPSSSKPSMYKADYISN